VSSRLALALVLSAATVLVGLAACCLQSECHARARRLAALQRECELLEAANTQAQAIASAHVYGEANPRDLTLEGSWD
jgi:type II secretory pathway component PulJ